MFRVLTYAPPFRLPRCVNPHENTWGVPKCLGQSIEWKVSFLCRSLRGSSTIIFRSWIVADAFVAGSIFFCRMEHENRNVMKNCQGMKKSKAVYRVMESTYRRFCRFRDICRVRKISQRQRSLFRNAENFQFFRLTRDENFQQKFIYLEHRFLDRKPKKILETSIHLSSKRGMGALIEWERLLVNQRHYTEQCAIPCRPRHEYFQK